MTSSKLEPDILMWLVSIAFKPLLSKLESWAGPDQSFLKTITFPMGVRKLKILLDVLISTIQLILLDQVVPSWCQGDRPWPCPRVASRILASLVKI
jgi:hypothetical protein